MDKIYIMNDLRTIPELQLSESFFMSARQIMEWMYTNIFNSELKRSSTELNTIIPVVFNMTHGVELGMKGILIYLNKIDKNITKRVHGHKLDTIFNQLKNSVTKCKFQKDKTYDDIVDSKVLIVLENSIKWIYEFSDVKWNGTSKSTPSVIIRYGFKDGKHVAFTNKGYEIVIFDVINTLHGLHWSIQELEKICRVDLKEISCNETNQVELFPGMKISFEMRNDLK
jgi:hypothetical protein